jgi:hypothetical protein
MRVLGQKWLEMPMDSAIFLLKVKTSLRAQRSNLSENLGTRIILCNEEIASLRSQ